LVDADRTQLEWKKVALGHEAGTVMSRHHFDNGGGIRHYGLRAAG
jgi:hypothetical protein